MHGFSQDMKVAERNISSIYTTLHVTNVKDRNEFLSILAKRLRKSPTRKSLAHI
jgi:hypothetical protein